MIHAAGIPPADLAVLDARLALTALRGHSIVLDPLPKPSHLSPALRVTLDLVAAGLAKELR